MDHPQDGSQEPIDKHHTLSIVDWCRNCHVNLFVVERRRAPTNQEAETPAHDGAPNDSQTLTEEGGTDQ